jgi:hypothetical protein
VKLVRASKDAVILQLGSAEQRIFVEMLSLYPVVPADYQPLSRSLKDKAPDEDQQLLNEALAEQRDALRQHVQNWLSARNRFRQVKSGFNFTLCYSDAEWMLQVLNDIRVGHWLLLGSPEELHEVDDLAGLAPEMHRAWAAMELSGMFQMEILVALEVRPAD